MNLQKFTLKNIHRTNQEMNRLKIKGKKLQKTDISTEKKSKKSSTRICTIQSTSTKDQIVAQQQKYQQQINFCGNHTFINRLYCKVNSNRNNTYNNCPKCSCTLSNKKKVSKFTKNSHKKVNNNKIKCGPVNSIQLNVVESLVKKEANLIQSIDSSSSLPQYSESNTFINSESNQAALHGIISMSLATNQMVNKIFISRKQRLLNNISNKCVRQCAKGNSDTNPNINKEAGRQIFSYLQDSSKYNKQNYSQLFTNATRKLAILPTLKLKKIDQKASRMTKNFSSTKLFELQANQYICQSRKRWRTIHNQLHSYLINCHQKQSQHFSKIQNLSEIELIQRMGQKKYVGQKQQIRSKQKIKYSQSNNSRSSILLSQLAKQGQVNQRWFQFQECLNTIQINTVNKYCQQFQADKYYLQRRMLGNRFDSLSDCSHNHNSPQARQILCFEQNQKIQEEESKEEREEGTKDQQITRMFMNSYNFENYTWKGDVDISSGQSEQLFQREVQSLKKLNNRQQETHYEQDEPQTLQIDFDKYDQEDEVLEQKTDVLMNWLIDEFVIQLASQLDLQLFYGLQQGSQIKNNIDQQVSEAKNISKRIQQTFIDSLEIDQFSRFSRTKCRPVIIDALQETGQLYFNKNLGQILANQSDYCVNLIKSQLKKSLIYRQDCKNMKCFEKSEDQFKMEVKNQIAYNLSELALQQILASQVKTLNKIILDYMDDNLPQLSHYF